MGFYCNGKKDICDCDILCADCNFFDNSGGEKRMTNADRIRAMTEEELIALFVLEDKCPPKRYASRYCDNCDSCKECWIDWLKQPAEVDHE